MPKRYGGMELGLKAWVDLTVEIAKADAAHAWCASLIMHHPHYLAQFPDAAQAEAWSDGPNVAMAATFTPTSKVDPVEGGYRVSCSIPYLSGINHCSRVMIGGMVPTPDGPPDWTLFLVPEGRVRGPGHLAHRGHARDGEQHRRREGRVHPDGTHLAGRRHARLQHAGQQDQSGADVQRALDYLCLTDVPGADARRGARCT